MAHFSESELLERFHLYIASIEDQLWKRENSGDIIDDIPLITIISRPEVLEFINTNKIHQQLTGYSPEEVRENSEAYTGNIVHSDSLKNVKKFLPEFYARQGSHKTMAFVQYAKLLGEQEYSPLITFTKPPKSPNSSVIRLSVTPGEMGKMSGKMERIVKMDQFRLKHFKRFQHLTSREIEIMKLLAYGHTNPRIAEQLFISRQTVETHRKNIKSKLELGSFRDLMRFALAFDLIEL
ncbi:response regulator transcription factor [Lunatibacter salilacus]|uniref:response regulator transcription factor n=1 Tax=Lunatibacter salilacus TaxID=2483804 RepID=UPI00131BB064|nr:helix-turn-helix transcriptional regulator [Lunatibacter salilacus]